MPDPSSSPGNSARLNLVKISGALGSSSYDSGITSELASLRSVVARQSNNAANVSLVVRDRDRSVVFLEIANSPFSDSCEIQDFTRAACQGLCAGSEIVIYPVHLDGAFSPFQRERIRACHMRLPLLSKVSLKERRVVLQGAQLNNYTPSDVQKVLGQLTGTLGGGFKITEELCASDQGDLLVSHRTTTAGDGEPENRFLSQIAERLAHKIWPLFSDPHQDIRGTNSVAIDLDTKSIHLTQEAPEGRSGHCERAVKRVAELVPAHNMSLTVSLGTSHHDIHCYLAEKFRGSAVTLKYSQQASNLEVSLLVVPEAITAALALKSELWKSRADLSLFNVRPYFVERRCDLTEALFTMIPVEWGFFELVRSRDNRRCLLASRFRQEHFPSEEVETFLRNHFPDGVYVGTGHLRSIPRSDPLFSEIFQMLPTKCDLSEVVQSQITEALLLVGRKPPSEECLKAIRARFGDNVHFWSRPSPPVPKYVEPAVRWLDSNEGMIQPVPVERTTGVTLEGFGGCQMIGGSRLKLMLGGVHFLLECGSWVGSRRTQQFQEGELANIDFAFYSHIHGDHVGEAGRIAEQGLNVPLLMTRATAVAMYPVLLEQAKRRSLDRAWIEKLYKCVRTVPFDTKISLTPTLSLTLHDAGHIVGSATAVFETVHDGRPYSVAYTGDFRTQPSRFYDGAAMYPPVDVIITEGTYGMRDQVNRQQVEQELITRIKETVLNGGTVIMPCLAYGRAQEVLAILGDHTEWFHENRIPLHIVGGVVEKTKIFEYLLQDDPTVFSKRARSISLALKNTLRKDQSTVRANDASLRGSRGGKIIVLAGGMVCGKSEEVIRKYCSSPNNLLVLSCFQTPRTIGREILDFSRGLGPAPRAFQDFQIQVLYTPLSAHSSGIETVEYVTQRLKPGGKVVLVHGEAPELAELRDWLLATDVPSEVFIPAIGDKVTLL